MGLPDPQRAGRRTLPPRTEARLARQRSGDDRTAAHVRQITRGYASPARLRSCIEHVVAARKCRVARMIGTVGKARATAKLASANPAEYVTRFLRPANRQAA